MSLKDQAKKSVKENKLSDQNEEKGGFDRVIVPEGTYPARFVGWVEVGDRDGGEYQGKKKPNTRKAYAYFELLSKKLAQEIEVGGVKKTIYPVHREMLDVKTGEKANLTKLFKRMAAGRSLMHIVEMLEEPFRVRIVHFTKGEGKDAKTYANIRDKDLGWLVFPPTFEKVNEETGESEIKTLNVPKQTVETQLLLWDDPSEEQWASIFIAGDRQKKNHDGTETTVSKNWLQQSCINEALDFEGSPLQALLAGKELPSFEVVDDEDGEPAPKPDGDESEDEPDMGNFEDLDDEIPH